MDIIDTHGAEIEILSTDDRTAYEVSLLVQGPPSRSVVEGNGEYYYMYRRAGGGGYFTDETPNDRDIETYRTTPDLFTPYMNTRTKECDDV